MYYKTCIVYFLVGTFVETADYSNDFFQDPRTDRFIEF